MNTFSPDRRPTAVVAQDAVFSALREKLAHEVSSSAVLAELLESVNRMQEAHANPESFKKHFDGFVCRAEEYVDVVRGFFPSLVSFLPAHHAVDTDLEAHCRETAPPSGMSAGLL
jgi:hypothetical protein